MAGDPVTLRTLERADRDTLEPWFPPESSGDFIDQRWLEWAVESVREPGDVAFFVGCRDGDPVSVLSFHLDSVRKDRATVSIIVAPDVRRTGIARGTVEALRDAFPEINEIVAYVDPENTASLQLVTRVGLIEGPSDVDNRRLFVWRRDATPLPNDWTPPHRLLRGPG